MIKGVYWAHRCWYSKGKQNSLPRESGSLVATAEFEPCSFEPMQDLSDSDEEGAENPNEIARRGNTVWCSCGHCENWENQQERECLCCQEMDEAVSKLSGENY